MADTTTSSSKTASLSSTYSPVPPSPVGGYTTQAGVEVPSGPAVSTPSGPGVAYHGYVTTNWGTGGYGSGGMGGTPSSSQTTAPVPAGSTITAAQPTPEPQAATASRSDITGATIAAWQQSGYPEPYGLESAKRESGRFFTSALPAAGLTFGVVGLTAVAPPVGIAAGTALGAMGVVALGSVAATNPKLLAEPEIVGSLVGSGFGSAMGTGVFMPNPVVNVKQTGVYGVYEKPVTEEIGTHYSGMGIVSQSYEVARPYKKVDTVAVVSGRSTDLKTPLMSVEPTSPKQTLGPGVSFTEKAAKIEQTSEVEVLAGVSRIETRGLLGRKKVAYKEYQPGWSEANVHEPMIETKTGDIRPFSKQTGMEKAFGYVGSVKSGEQVFSKGYAQYEMGGGRALVDFSQTTVPLKTAKESGPLGRAPSMKETGALNKPPTISKIKQAQAPTTILLEPMEVGRTTQTPSKVVLSPAPVQTQRQEQSNLQVVNQRMETTERQVNVQRVFTPTVSASALGTSQFTALGQVMRQGRVPATVQNVLPAQATRQSQALAMKTAQLTETRTKQRMAMATPAVMVPNLRFRIKFPMGGLGGWGRGRPEWPNMGPGSRMGSIYKPSAVANVFDIRGNVPKQITGFEFVRPKKGRKKRK